MLPLLTEFSYKYLATCTSEHQFIADKGKQNEDLVFSLPECGWAEFVSGDTHQWAEIDCGLFWQFLFWQRQHAHFVGGSS